MPPIVVTLFGAVLLMSTAAVSATDGDLVLENQRFHLGRAGEWEWAEFKDRPVEAAKLEKTFESSANTAAQTLRIWQRGVKLGWRVHLNGRAIGSLAREETAMEHLIEIAPGLLRDGENLLTIDAPPTLDDIEIGPILLSPKPVKEWLSGAAIAVTVTDRATGKALPCRLTVTRRDRTLQPLRAGPASDVAVRTGVVYLRDGRTTLSLPPGDYVLFAGRGFEWSVERAEISVGEGETKTVALQPRREVATEGWIAADSHIHTLTHSGHGDATIAERMLTIAGEGIELAVATDHNHHTDYAPFAASVGVAEKFTPVIGNEITTKQGHFNAFPIQPGAALVNHQEVDWAKLLPAMRATPGVKVITLNHPRDMHSGFIPFGGLHFNPKTGSHRHAAHFDVDAIEVITSGALQSDIHLLYRDWFALLNRGHRIAAIGSSDTHDVNRFILGQGRTYVAAKDADPANLDLDEVWRSYQQGRLLVSLGLLTTLKVNDRFTVGDLATGLGESIKVEAAVNGPSWVKADRIELFANGILIREQRIQDDSRAGEKARVTWMLPKPAHDVHLVAIATGPGVTEPYWEIPRPYQPSSKTFVPRVIGSTNPIWLDADGDGQFQAAIAYAQKIVQQNGADREKLRETLKHYDASVAVQVESLITPTSH